MREQIEAQAADLGLSRTRVTGWKPPDEVRSLIATSRYLVIPSSGEETASLAVLEALAMGRPVIVSDSGALPELPARGTGLVFPAVDEQRLAQRFLELMGDAELCRRLGERDVVVFGRGSLLATISRL